MQFFDILTLASLAAGLPLDDYAGNDITDLPWGVHERPFDAGAGKAPDAAFCHEQKISAKLPGNNACNREDCLKLRKHFDYNATYHFTFGGVQGDTTERGFYPIATEGTCRLEVKPLKSWAENVNGVTGTLESAYWLGFRDIERILGTALTNPYGEGQGSLVNETIPAQEGWDDCDFSGARYGFHWQVFHP